VIVLRICSRVRESDAQNNQVIWVEASPGIALGVILGLPFWQILVVDGLRGEDAWCGACLVELGVSGDWSSEADRENGGIVVDDRITDLAAWGAFEVHRSERA